jgi:hypothetical protein
MHATRRCAGKSQSYASSIYAGLDDSRVVKEVGPSVAAVAGDAGIMGRSLGEISAEERGGFRPRRCRLETLKAARIPWPQRLAVLVPREVAPAASV